MKKINLFFVFVVTSLLFVSSVFAEQTGSTNGVIAGGENDGNVTFNVGPGMVNPSGNITKCGDGIKNRPEEDCDGSDLNAQTCESKLGTGYTGTLSCSSTCTFVPSACVEPNNNEGGGGGGGGSTGSTGGGGGGSSSCIENWVCSEWGSCSDGVQTRTCSDSKKCGTTKIKPVLERDCSVEGKSGEEGIGAEANNTGSKFSSLLTGAVIGALGSRAGIAVIVFILLVLIAWYIVYKRKNK